MRIAIGLALVLGVAGCGESHNPFDNGDGGLPTRDLSGTGGDGGGGQDATPVNLDLAQTAGAPMVTVTAPAAGATVHGDTVQVAATIVAGANTAIDASTVNVTIVIGSATVKAPMTLQPDGSYGGSIDISAASSGNMSLVVAATDLDKKTGYGTQSFVHDHGPVITFIQPTAPTAHGQLDVDIIVTDDLYGPISPSMVSAGIILPADVTLTQKLPGPGGKSIELTATVNFGQYSPPLDGKHLLTVIAQNGMGATGRGIKNFSVDNDGPVITFVNPLAGQFVGGVLNIDVQLADDSGIKDGSVVAVFGGSAASTVTLSPVTGSSDYAGVFDVRALGRNYVYPIFSVRADDIFGNHSEQAIEIIVDNEPPSISMDPPSIRVSTANGSMQRECSQVFDPLGDETINDGEVGQQIITVRARASDNGNTAPGLSVVRFSGMDISSVKMYAIPAPTGSEILAVDTDGDGLCDDVNPLLVPANTVTASNQAVAVDLVQLANNGTANFLATPLPPDWSQWQANGCDVQGDPALLKTPAALCSLAGTDLSLALPTHDLNAPVAIWTIPPLFSDAAGCMGLQFDTLNRLPGGPACLVTVGKDTAGNHNVSKPIYICIVHAQHDCDTFVPNPAACLGTYDKATNTANTTACTIDNPYQSNHEVVPIDRS